MNESIRVLMDQLFENAPDTEEIRSLREEITDNCEEHFRDLTAGGLSDEEAIREISSSLRGMEDVVAELSRKAPILSPEDTVSVPEAEPLADPADIGAGEEVPEGPGHLTLPVSGLKNLVAQAGSEDLEMGVSPDAMLHVSWNTESHVEVTPVTEGDTLRLTVKRNMNTPDGTENGKQFFSVNNEEGSVSINFRDMIRKVKSVIQTGFQALEASTVRILVPAGALASLDVSGRSGDILSDGCGFLSAHLRSVSGDITYRDTAVLNSLDCGSTSGDLSVDAFTESLNLSTLSGDVDVEGGAVNAEIRSTSGDVNLDGGLARGGINTVSGDIDISLHGRLIAENLRIHSTSGDVDLSVGDAFPAHFAVSSVSGDIENALESVSGSAEIQIDTVSGDITIR